MATRSLVQRPERIPSGLLYRMLESISLLEVLKRAIDDDEPQMALQVALRELHAIHDELDKLNLPTPAERLRLVNGMHKGMMEPRARAALRREIKAEIAAGERTS